MVSRSSKVRNVRSLRIRSRTRARRRVGLRAAPHPRDDRLPAHDEPPSSLGPSAHGFTTMGSAGMPTRHRIIWRLTPLLLTLVLGSAVSCRTAAPGPATGVATAAVPRGSLMIVGGGPRPPEVMQRFVELAGGPRARLLVMQMATAEPSTSSVSEFTTRWGAADAREANLTREQATSDTISRIFEGITGIWFVGGDQNRVTAAMAGTPA